MTMTAQAEVGGLGGLIASHRIAKAETERLIDSDAPDSKIQASLANAENVYVAILSWPVDALEVGRMKARYLLSILDEDCPQKEQVRRFLEAMA